MIDSTLFIAKIPAGTYAAGDRVQLNVKDGPSVVRSGRGAAILKRIIGLTLSSASGVNSFWRIHIKNSDWIDDAIVTAGDLSAAAVLDQHSGAIRIGNDTQLIANSSWQVWAECMYGGTTTVDNSLACLIDVDYPQVSSITDPDALIGIPASIEFTAAGIAYTAPGDMDIATWNTFNVDFLKAGYQYALQEIGMFSSSSGGGPRGFVKISNAAGMGGLSRIVPVATEAANIRQTIQYATLLVKGPMDVSYMMFKSTGTTSTTTVETVFDFVKRRM